MLIAKNIKVKEGGGREKESREGDIREREREREIALKKRDAGQETNLNHIKTWEARAEGMS